MPLELTGLKEECGVFGVWGHPQASRITYYALHSLQHRGQEGTGIVVTDGKSMQGKKGEGLVTDIFTVQSMAELKGCAAIGHVRYSLGGADGYENVQPLLFRSSGGSLALCHNGNVLNGSELRRQLEEQGSIFQTSSDSEVLAHLIRRSRLTSAREQVRFALSLLQGAYAFLLLTEKELIAALDPKGLRPLSLGRLGDAWVVASETCAFDIIGAQYERDVLPGELIIINEQGIHSETLTPDPSRTLCAMEYVYFSRPDSNLGGINVHTARKELGRQLARECPVEADVVTGVPDSSLSAAIGYAEELRIPYEMGLIKSRYIGRTFIEPSPSLREQGVKLKLSAVRGVVEGRRVALVDDSFVRGTTGRRITRLLREAGAKEVHVLISSPPIKYPCYYGIDTLSTAELLAANYSVQEITEIIGADSLHFLSVEGMGKVLGSELCLACYTGDYPTPVPQFEVEEDGRW